MKVFVNVLGLFVLGLVLTGEEPDLDDASFMASLRPVMADASSPLEIRSKAGKCLTERLKKKPDFIEFVRKQMVCESNSEVRLFLFTSLVNVEEGKSCDDCIWALTDPSPVIRKYALIAISKYQIQSAYQYVSLGLISSNTTERIAALYTLQKVVPNDAAPFFVAALDDRDADVAKRAAYLLRSCPKQKALPLILRYLNTPREPQGREDVLKALAATVNFLLDEHDGHRNSLSERIQKWIQMQEKTHQSSWASDGGEK